LNKTHSPLIEPLANSRTNKQHKMQKNTYNVTKSSGTLLHCCCCCCYYFLFFGYLR